MNEFVAKKLGEVLAFSRIGLECSERGGSAFAEAMGEHTEHIKHTLSGLAMAVEQKGNDITIAKAEATVQKLRGMMEAYIGDEWQNPTELLEWLSFFAGAGGAHWSLVKGAASSMQDADLEQKANEATEAYAKVLALVNEQLLFVGKTRAAS